MQISTRKRDYLIDTLALRSHMALLAPLLADPATLKLLHGGDSDVLWLQRDFQLYLVNVFDTQKAAQVLGLPQHSLGFLLSSFCGLATDKALQTSNWRRRPLSQQQLHYAAIDSHYLEYIAAQMLRQLEERSAGREGSTALQRCWVKCQAMTLTTYQPQSHQDATTSAALAIVRRFATSVQPPRAPDVRNAARDLHATGYAARLHDAVQQLVAPRPDVGGGQPDGRARTTLHAFADCVYVLCQWRDLAARAANEGVQYMLPDAAIVALAHAQPGSSSELVRTAVLAVEQHSALASETEAECCLDQLRQDVEPLSAALRSAAAGERAWAGWQGLLAVAAAGQDRKGRDADAQLRAYSKLVRKFSAKGPVYDNCRMLSMAGEMLCHCDRKKLEWYVSKGLAERVSEEPPTIRLRFEHSTADQVTGSNEFYQHSKANRCVVCGEEGHYLRYRVVPSCYRRHLPVHLKSHRSHDVVLLCVRCHEGAHKATEAVKRQLADEYGFPLTLPPPMDTYGRLKQGASVEELAAQGGDEGADNGGADGSASPVNVHNVRRCALALHRFGADIPPQRTRELELVVREFLGVQAGRDALPLTDEQLQAAMLVGLGARQRRRMLGEWSRLRARRDARQTAAAGSSGGGGGGGVVAGEVDGDGCDAEDASAVAFGSAEGSGGERLLAADGVVSSPPQPGAGCHPEPASPAVSGHMWHGQRVVEAAAARGGEAELLALMTRFRAAFVDALRPRFLPESWTVDHGARREFGEYSVYNPSRQAATST